MSLWYKTKFIFRQHVVQLRPLNTLNWNATSLYVCLWFFQCDSSTIKYLGLTNGRGSLMWLWVEGVRHVESHQPPSHSKHSYNHCCPCCLCVPNNHKRPPSESLSPNQLRAPLGDESQLWLVLVMQVRYCDLGGYLQWLINNWGLYNLPESLVVLFNLFQWGSVDLSLVFLHRHVVSVVVTFHALQRWMGKK